MKHTPGPWQVHAQDTSTMIVTGKTKGWGHDHLGLVYTPSNSPEHLANLHLIQAAPELLEFCNMILHGIAEEGHFDIKAGTPADQILRALIAKATVNY